MNNRPIPVHCELKNPKRWKLNEMQKRERARIERSGSIYILIFSPEAFHKFFLEHGMTRIIMPAQSLSKNYTEHDLSTFVRQYLQMAEDIYGIYWAHNQQGPMSNKGRPDWYFEITNLDSSKGQGHEK